MSSHQCPVALLNALGVLPYAASFDHVGPTLLSCDDPHNLHNTQQTQACSVEHMQLIIPPRRKLLCSNRLLEKSREERPVENLIGYYMKINYKLNEKVISQLEVGHFRSV